ncbi:hypothetical protein BT091_11685, partial [Corynebacterium diphtheriae]
MNAEFGLPAVADLVFHAPAADAKDGHALDAVAALRVIRIDHVRRAGADAAEQRHVPDLVLEISIADSGAPEVDEVCAGAIAVALLQRRGPEVGSAQGRV